MAFGGGHNVSFPPPTGLSAAGAILTTVGGTVNPDRKARIVKSVDDVMHTGQVVQRETMDSRRTAIYAPPEPHPVIPGVI